MPENLGEAILTLSTKDSKFRGGLRNAERIAKSAAKRMTAILTIPLAALGIAATKVTATFDDEMNKLVSLVGLPRDAVEELKQKILNLGPAVGKMPTELARAIFPIASAGFNAAESFDVLAAASLAAATGMGEVIVPAEATTKILANYGDQVNSAAEATGILLATTKAAAGAPEQMGAAFTKFLPTARALGVEIRTISAEFAFLTRALRSPASAANALNAVLNKLRLPPIELIPELEKVGLSLERLKQVTGEGGAAAGVRALADALGVTSLNFQRVFQDEQAFIGAQLLLAGQTKGLNTIMQDLAASGVQSLIDAFKEAAKSPMFKFRQNLAAMNAGLIILGNALLPVVIPLIRQLTDWIVRVSRAFARLSPETQKMILGVAGIITIAGPVILTIAVLSRAFVVLAVVAARVVVNVAKAFFFMAGQIVTAVTRLMLFMFSVPGAIAGALLAVIGAILFFPKTIIVFFEGVIQAIKVAFVEGFHNFIVVPFQNAFNALLDFLPDDVIEFLGLKPIQPEDIIPFTVVDVVKNTVAAAGEEAGKEFEAMKEGILKTVDKMIDGLKALLPEGIMDFLFPGGLEQTQIDLEALLNGIGTLPSALDGVAQAGMDVAETFEEMGDKIKSSIASATTDAIVNLRSLGDFAKSIMDIILQAFIHAFIGIPVGQLFGNLFGSTFGGGSAHGGPAGPSKVRLIGEQGPELFRPDRPGTIIPNSALLGDGEGRPVTMIFQAGLSAEHLALVRNVAAEIAGDRSMVIIKRAFGRN